jgi:hypothetical protein
MDHITITVNGAVVYDSELQIARTPLPVKPADPDNPFVAYKAQSIGLYDLMAKWGRYLTAQELAQAKAAGYDTSTLEPAATLTPDGYDQYKTNLTADDQGKVLKARAGRTHYTYAGIADWRTVSDGLMHVDARCSVSIDGGPWMDVTGASSKVGRGSTLDIECDYEWSVQVGG